ncbi:MAG: tetratricopeptide repeat protein, partial [Planctomycetes bacterium]|nr:tetratricopeptide repeat protein [Planctomycetota bacterium]
MTTRALPCLLLVAITAAAYINADHEQFLFDSAQADLLAKPAAAGLQTFREFWRQPLKPGQHLATLSFALNDAVNRALGMDGLDVTGFLAFNVLVHAVNACLVYLLIRALLRQLEPARPPPVWMPAGLALLFAVHPLAASSVAYIIQRRGSMATLFCLLGLLAWLRARRLLAGSCGTGVPPVRCSDGRARPGWFRPAVLILATLLCYWLACRSKETGLTLPIIVALIEFCFRAAGWSRRRFAAWTFGGLVLYPAAMLVGLWAIGRFNPADATRLSAFREPLNWGVGSHFLSMSRAVAHFWKLLLLPLPRWCSIDHDFAMSFTLLQHGAVFALALHVALIGLALLAARRGLVLIAFGLLWFYAVQVPYMVLPQWEVFVEYKSYMPSVGFVLVLAGLLQVLRERVSPRIQIGALVVAAVLLLTTTIRRNAIYQSEHNLWADAVAKAPNSFRPLLVFGTVLTKEGRPLEAIPYLTTAWKLAQTDTTATARWKQFYALTNLADALLRTGRGREALPKFQAAADLDPANPSAWY